MNHFSVGLTNTSLAEVEPNSLSFQFAQCGHGPSTATAGATIHVPCSPTSQSHRYVFIGTGRELMTFCELEVYGEG